MLTKEQILAMCDHTVLRPEAELPEIVDNCRLAQNFHCASMCLAPSFVKPVRNMFGDSLRITTVVGLYLGILIGNSVLTEIVFSRPGLGKLILTALAQRDYTLLQGMIVVYTLMVIVVNLVTDLTYGLLDPRVQYK